MSIRSTQNELQYSSKYSYNSPVCVTEKVWQHVNMYVDAGGTEGGDDGEDVVGGPTGHKCTKYQRYGLQCFSGAVFSF